VTPSNLLFACFILLATVSFGVIWLPLAGLFLSAVSLVVSLAVAREDSAPGG
jgi:hypothetical protein